jgi:cytochrome b561
MAANVSRAVAAGTRIAAGDDRTRYDGFAITLHWLTALLVLTQFGLAELWDFPPRDAKHLMIVAHMSFGIVLALVLTVRIAWRLTPGHRVRDAATGLVELASKVVHHVLYALLSVEVVLGFTLRWSGGEALSFFGVLIPPPFAAFSKPAEHWVGNLHNWTAWTIIVLAGGHACAALFHHYVLRDDVLSRMLPGRYARPEGQQSR